MPRWLPKVLMRVRELAARRQVRFTFKALRELTALGMGGDVEDACDVLANLAPEESAGRLISAVTGEWMYVFKPEVAGVVIYVKLLLRRECLVVSFHEDEVGGHEEESV